MAAAGSGLTRRRALLLTTVFGMAGCTTPSAEAAPPLRGTNWRLLPLQAPEMAPSPAAELKLDLDGSGYSGFTGCNRINGSFELNGQQLRLQLGAMSRKACIGPGDIEETRFVKALPLVAGWRFEGAELHLLDSAGQPVLRMRAAPAAR